MDDRKPSERIEEIPVGFLFGRVDEIAAILDEQHSQIRLLSESTSACIEEMRKHIEGLEALASDMQETSILGGK